MKSTIITILALGSVATVAGGIFKMLHYTGANYLLVGGITMALMSGALLALHLAQTPEEQPVDGN